MNESSRRYRTILPFCALIGAIMTGFYMIWLMNETPVYGLKLSLTLLYLWVVFSITAFFVWTRFLASRMEPFSLRWKLWWLIGSVVAGFWLSDNLPVVLPGSGAWRLVLFVCAGLGLGMVLFLASIFFATRYRPPNPPRARRLRWLVYALPMLAAWLLALLAFWPGMLSADSIDQWGQVLSGQFNNHHPAFHSFTLWLLTRLAPTPAVVALAQILALALVCGAFLAYLEWLGISPRWLWIAAVVLAFSPVNATMVNTLWKDILYSTAMLAFTGLVFRLVYSKGGWLAQKWSWLALGLTAALAALFRHNGLPVVLATLLALLVVARREWKPLAAALAIFLALYYGVTGPLYQWVGVQDRSELAEAAASIYRVAATADPGSQAEDVLQSMNPLSNVWQCSVYGEMLQADKRDGSGQPETLPQQAVNLVEHAPRLLAYDYRCNRSLTWIVWDPNGEVRNPSHAEYWIDDNPYGIAPDSKIPVLRMWLSTFVRATAHEPSINWLIWRPALYLYGFLFVIVLTTMRHRNLWILLAGAPVLFEALGFTLVTMPPNFRYHYPVYLLALTFWPLLFLAPRPDGLGQPQDTLEESNPA